MKPKTRRTYDRRSREAAAEETRRRIVRATVELHAVHGALGTTHEMIAHHAAVSIPTVYKYFQTRNDLIPHCVGLALADAPRLDASLFEGQAGVPSRLRALAGRAFAFYEFAARWLRWSARDAAELPAVRAMLEGAAQNREALVRAAMAPDFSTPPPRALIGVASTLIDFPAWQTLTTAGLTTAEAADAIGDALVKLVSNQPKEDL